MVFSLTSVGVPESARVVVSKLSPGTFGLSEYEKTPLPPVAWGRVTDLMAVPRG